MLGYYSGPVSLGHLDHLNSRITPTLEDWCERLDEDSVRALDQIGCGLGSYPSRQGAAGLRPETKDYDEAS